MLNRVKEIRLLRGMTQLELSEAANVGQATISNIETNRFMPRVDVAINIAKALKMPVEKIFIIDTKSLDNVDDW